MSSTQNSVVATPVQGNRFIRRKDAAKKLGTSIASLDRWVREGRICKPSHIGARASGWPESYLDSLIAGLTKQSNQPTNG